MFGEGVYVHIGIHIGQVFARLVTVAKRDCITPAAREYWAT